jgi:GTP cyclohydrolase II
MPLRSASASSLPAPPAPVPSPRRGDVAGGAAPLTARLPESLLEDPPGAIERPALVLSTDARLNAPSDAARRAAVRLERACGELRHGRPVGLLARAPAQAAVDPGDPASQTLLVQALETLDAAAFDAAAAWPGGRHLLLTAERHAARGDESIDEAQWLPLPLGSTLAQAQAIAGLAGPGGGLPPAEPAIDALPTPWCAAAAPARSLAAALQLTKWARLTPALLVTALAPAQAATLLASNDWLSVQVDDVALRERDALPALHRVSDARIPIGEAGASCKLILFREPERDAEHVAVVYGQPDLTQPVPVRLHSSCLTGDLLGSLRCDCGEQLLRAAAQLQRSDGVLLYLAQEGRGTGLASKLRAYRLQDSGLDTLDADRHLGFRGDERDFRPAAAMLVALGIRRVALMTNNPAKIGALTRGGIEVVERLPLVAAPNPHNARYLSTKRERAGHLSQDEQLD